MSDQALLIRNLVPADVGMVLHHAVDGRTVTCNVEMEFVVVQRQLSVMPCNVKWMFYVLEDHTGSCRVSPQVVMCTVGFSERAPNRHLVRNGRCTCRFSDTF